jgi:hypothetical protein
MEKRPLRFYLFSLIVFFGFILTAFILDVKAYVNDSVFMILILSFLYWKYDSFKLKGWIFLLIVFGFALHNMGVYGYYNLSPVGLQWDHITHFVGEFVAAIFIYNFFFAKGFFHTGRGGKLSIYFFVLLATLGVGVLVEFLEFFGYLFVGEGVGIFGHGLGDVNTEFINSEWFNTMFDFIYNFLGALIGILFCRFIFKDKWFRK